MSKVVRPHRPKGGEVFNGVYYFVPPFRPAWLYPAGSRLTTKWGTFEVGYAGWDQPLSWIFISKD